VHVVDGGGNTEGENMTSETAVRRFCFDLVTTRPFAIAVVTTFMLLYAARGCAQQDPPDAPSNRQYGGGAVVVQNPDAQSTSSSQEPSLPDAPSAAAQIYKPVGELTLADRFAIYRQAVLRPYSLLGPAFGAGIGQWEDEPPEWGQGAKGYGRRVASGMSRQLISETIRFGVAAADGEDPRYHRSQDTGVWKRAEHAIVETFTSETADGGRMPAYSRFAGTYGAAFISNAWYPDSRATAGWALRRGSTALASSVGFHLFEEFLPRKYFKAIGVSNDTQ
jgi:hypothetical protein